MLEATAGKAVLVVLLPIVFVGVILFIKVPVAIVQKEKAVARGIRPSVKALRKDLDLVLEDSALVEGCKPNDLAQLHGVRNARHDGAAGNSRASGLDHRRNGTRSSDSGSDSGSMGRWSLSRDFLGDAATGRIMFPSAREGACMSSTAKLLLAAAALAVGATLLFVLSGTHAPLSGGLDAGQEITESASGPDQAEAELAAVPSAGKGARAVAQVNLAPDSRGAAGGETLAAFAVDVQIVAEKRSEGRITGELVVLERSSIEGGNGEVIGEAVYAALAASPDAARMELPENGRARIELPGGSMDPVLVLVDRNWYAPRPLALRALEAGAEGLELEVRQGACLVLRPSVSQGVPAGTMRVSGFDMGGRRSGGVGIDLDLAGDGEILVRGIDPGRAWTIVAQAEAHHCPLKSGVEIEAGAERVIEMPFIPGATLMGRVVDDAGNGLAEVAVATASKSPWLGGADARRTTTADDGSFVLKGVAPGRIQLNVELEGWRKPEIDPFDVADMERREGLVIQLDQGSAISGTIAWEDGQPAEGARVRATTLTPSQWGGFGGGRVQTEAETVAAADGSFRLTGLGQGQFTIRASHRPDDFADDSSAPLWRATRLAGSDSTLDLTLVGPELIEGRVVDDRDEPVAEFDVVAKPAERGARDERASFEDEDGRFRFARIGTGEWTLEARAEGFVPSGEASVTLPGAPGELTLRLDRTAAVMGKVLDPRGAPLAGAEVQVDEPGRGPFGGGPRYRTTSDESGAFELKDLPPGTTALVARAEGWADAEALTLELAPAEERPNVVLSLRAGGRIIGAVYGDDGDPIANQRVNYGENSMGFGARAETRTAADGTFEFESVTPGTWTVSAAPSMEEMSDRMNNEGASFVSVMGELVAETIDVPDGETIEVYLGGEPKIPVTITGVVSRGGQILADVEVYATSEGSAIFEGMKTARTDTEGAYSLTVDRPGAYLVSARDGAAGVEVAATVGRSEAPEIDLAIPDTMLSGRVKRSDGEPAGGIQINVQREDGLGRIRWSGDQATTDDDGRWEIPSLEPGVYTVRVNSSSWQRQSQKRWGKVVRTGITLEADASVDRIDFELDEAGKVAGTVLGTDGQALSGATIFFRDPSGAFVDRVSGDISDASGAFEATGLAPGAYTVSVRMPGFASSDSTACTVRSGETSEVELRVDVGVTLEINVVDGNGLPIRGRVEVFDRDDREVGAPRTVAQVRKQFNAGVSTFVTEVGPLPPGRYEVRVTAEDGRVQTKRLNLRASGEVRKIRIKIKD